jgi:hypothetical protein
MTPSSACLTLSPVAFPITLPPFCFLSLSLSLPFLYPPFVPQAAPSFTYSPTGPPRSHKPDTTRPVGKCRNGMADSHSLDASAVSSRRLVRPARRPLDDGAGEAPGVAAWDRCSPPSSVVHQFITPPHISTMAGQSRVSTLTGCATVASPLRRPVADLHHGWSGVGTGADCAATRPMEKMAFVQPVPCSRMAQRFTGAGSK